MNILQVVPYFVPAWNYGGPLQVAYGLSKELVKRGHKITVYTTDAFNATSRVKDKKEVIDGVEIKRFKNLSNALAFKYNVSLPLGMFPELRRTLSSFDIVHLHEYRTILNIAVHHYAKKYGIPYVLQAHGSVPRRLTKQNLKKLYDNLWGYRILKDATKVIALTQIEAEQYKSMGIMKDKIEIVPNGVDLSGFRELPKRGEFRRKYSIGENEKIILFLGRIHIIKGLELLVKAYAQLLKVLAKVKLVIAGPYDRYLLQLEQLIADLKIGNEVIFIGPLFGDDKLQAYVDADVYVLPSASEGFPITVFESCACGTPVIITDRCNIGDIVASQAGIVIPYDEGQLTEALLSMLSDDKMRQYFGNKGKLLVRDKFNWENIAEQVEKIYSTILAGKDKK